MKAYCRLRFSLAARAEGPLVAALWGAGTTGLEVRESGTARLEVDAFFPAPLLLPAAALEPGSGYWGVVGCELVAAGQLDEGDWLAPYRERAMPRPVGRLLIVDPREPHTQAGRGAARDPVSGRTLLRLPARTAFGTGSHESTRLAIELLERQDVEGLRVLDVGSGTGILAFVSLVLGARSVVGVEIDAAAALTASENQRLNEMFFGLVVGAPGCLRAGSQFDLGLVNVVPDAIRSELPMIAGLLRKGGRAVFSGFLVDQAGEVLPRLRRHGFEPLDDLRESEWMAVLVERGGAR